MTVIRYSIANWTKFDLIKQLVELFPHQTTVILIIYGQLLVPATSNISPGVEKGVLITEEAQSSFPEQMLTHVNPKDIQLTRTNIVSPPWEDSLLFFFLTNSEIHNISVNHSYYRKTLPILYSTCVFALVWPTRNDFLLFIVSTLPNGRSFRPFFFLH